MITITQYFCGLEANCLSDINKPIQIPNHDHMNDKFNLELITLLKLLNWPLQILTGIFNF